MVVFNSINMYAGQIIRFKIASLKGENIGQPFASASVMENQQSN